MRLTQRKPIKWNYTLLAFLLPILGMFSVMLIRGFEPFGPVSMLYSDMYHQYFPFFTDFRKALLSGDSLLYNWNLGMGMDYLGLIAYYLASPLNLLSVLIPEPLLLEYFSILVPVKLGFAGTFFAIFLKQLFDKNDISITLFGGLYALCAWALGYHWNVMWLDTFALLPLVALGAISLLKSRKFVLYTLSLCFSVLSNYYIGFFTCIFVALLFICYEICRWDGFKKFFCDLGVMALYSALALGMTAILEIPAYAALQNTYSSVNTFPTGFRLNIADENTWKGLLDAMRQVAGNMNGGLAPSYKEGLPNLYCGVFTNIFAFLFLTCKQIKLRDKICAVTLLLFFNLSFIIRQLDYIWHGFHFTNMIPYRFSFLYSFVMLYMAYRAYLLRTRFRLWQVIVSGILSIGICLCSSNRTDIVYLAYNGVFLLLYLSILFYQKLQKRPDIRASMEEKRNYLSERNSRRKFCTITLLSVICVELALNLVNFGVDFVGTTVANYPKGTSSTQSMIRYMREISDDELFYRTETTHSQTLNDGALNHYHGISAFTSSANVNVTKFLKVLGYGAKESYNRYCFEESSPVSNLFLNLKYMLERDGRVEENNYFDEVHHYNKVYLLENNAWLPLGFLANNQILNVDIDTEKNTFLFQNELFRAATGVQNDVWQILDGNSLSVTAVDVSIRPQVKTGYTYYTTTPETGGTVVYRYAVKDSGLMCVNLNLSKKNNFSVWKNGTELYNESYSVPQSLSVCQVVPGDVVEIHLTCKADLKGTMTIQTAILDEALFRKGYDILAASPLSLTTFENTLIEGTISCDRDGILYTSIPQDGNWRASVDGKPAEIVTIGETMVGLLLPKGTHTITFTYRNTAFNLGWKISLACVVIFLSLYRSIYQPVRKTGKYKKSTSIGGYIKERRNTDDTAVSEDSGKFSDS